MSTAKTIDLSEIDARSKPVLLPQISTSDKVLICYKFFDSNEVIDYVVTKHKAMMAQIRPGNFLLLPYEESRIVNLNQVISIRELQIKFPGLYQYYTISLFAQDASEALIGFTFPAKNDFYYQVAEILRKAVDEAKSSPPSIVSNLDERLRLLTKLYDDGLITSEEFQYKRSEILNQL